MSKSNVARIDDTILTPGEAKELKVGTDKKYLKRAEVISRKLDNEVTRLQNIVREAEELQAQTEVPTTEVNDKDYDRISEIVDVSNGVTVILHQLTKRMARKYAGKEIEPLDQAKRKSLKVK